MEEKLSHMIQHAKVRHHFQNQANFEGPRLVRQVPDHKCDLPTIDTVIVETIRTGIFVQFRRKWMAFITLNPCSEEAKRICRSTDETVLEQRRHLHHYSYIIHPCSNARKFWDYFMIPILVLNLIVIPHVLYGNPTGEPVFLYIKLFVDIVGLLDVCVSCISGYIDVTTQLVILDMKKILMRYAKFMMFVDLISSFPLHFIFVSWEANPVLPICLMFLKLFRIDSFLNCILFASSTIRKNIFFIKMTKFFMYIVVLNIWTTLVMGLFLYKENQNFSYSLYTATKNFMLAGQNSPADQNEFLMLFTIIILIAGMLLNVFLIAALMEVYMKFTDNQTEFENFSNQIAEYMNYLKLPLSLRRKVHNYVNFKFKRYLHHEENILNTISFKLREEILHHTCLKLISEVDLFHNLPYELVVRIMQKMRLTVCQQNDVIIQSGSPGTAMYFIASGTVAVYASNGREVCHITDGGHFGEIALVINESRVATVVALHTCELYKLIRKDFLDAIEPYPECFAQIREVALTRLEQTMRVASQSDIRRESPPSSLSYHLDASSSEIIQ